MARDWCTFFLIKKKKLRNPLRILWDKHGLTSLVGWVSRDQTGRLLWAGAKPIQHMGTAIETEAEAIRWAISTMSGFGYKNVVVETDSLVQSRMISG